MIRRPFFGLTKPKLKYPVIEKPEQGAVKELPLPKKATLMIHQADVSSDDLMIKVGDTVRTGQRLRLTEENHGYVISTVTGTVSGISEYRGYLGKTCPTVMIDAVEDDQWDDEFKKKGVEPVSENALEFQGCLPGAPDFAALFNIQPPLDTIVINGVDKDLLVTTSQVAVQTEMAGLAAGVEALKKMAPEKRIVFIVPPNLRSQGEKTGAEVKVIDPTYPNTLPKMIMEKVLGKVAPAGKACEAVGVGFINAEAVVALGKAFSKGEISVSKILTVINKEGDRINVKARIGTPLSDILEALHIETNPGDRLVLGGPMFGQTVYTEDIPVSSDTDAIMVQDKGQIVWSSDTQCFNCGDCVRACPADIPVNMLVRLLENGLYDEAVKDYDLLSCIECGLCSYVCSGRIPVFQFIMLGKYEFDQISSAEGSNG